MDEITYKGFSIEVWLIERKGLLKGRTFNRSSLSLLLPFGDASKRFSHVCQREM